MAFRSSPLARSLEHALVVDVVEREAEGHVLEVDDGAAGIRVSQHKEQAAVHELDERAGRKRVELDRVKVEAGRLALALPHLVVAAEDAIAEEVPHHVTEVVAQVSSETPDFVPDSLLPDSEMVPDSLQSESQPSLCVRCGTTHAGNEYSEACRAARREARTCARCGLIHSEYNLGSRMIYDVDKFDCELFIPEVDKLQMDGNTILLPEHVLKKLDEIWEMKQEAKKLKLST